MADFNNTDNQICWRPRRTWVTRKILRENCGLTKAASTTLENAMSNLSLNSNDVPEVLLEEHVCAIKAKCKLGSENNKLKIFKPLTILVYDELIKVSRTMHFADFKQCVDAGQFIPSKIRYQYRTLLPRKNQYVWFRAQSNIVTPEDHDWFGNVRCSFDLLTFLRENKNACLFYIDCAYFGYSSASRILITTNTHQPGAKRIDLDALKYGDPLLFSQGRLLFLSRDCSRRKQWYGNHQTEFVVDPCTIDMHHLFKTCVKTAVSHAKANTIDRHGYFIPHQCLLYNSSDITCPSAWSTQETLRLLNQIFATN